MSDKECSARSLCFGAWSSAAQPSLSTSACRLGLAAQGPEACYLAFPSCQAQTCPEDVLLQDPLSPLQRKGLPQERTTFNTFRALWIFCASWKNPRSPEAFFHFLKEKCSQDSEAACQLIPVFDHWNKLLPFLFQHEKMLVCKMPLGLISFYFPPPV